MPDRPRMTFSAAVLDAPDANALADFYQRLLGWPYGTNEPGWVTLRPPDGSAGLTEPPYRIKIISPAAPSRRLSSERINPCIAATSASVAVLPVPIAQTGS